MSLASLVRAAALSSTLVAATNAQSTWIVDDDPGPGVDFTDLPPAVAAAAPFDTILVRAGFYSGTTIDKGVRIVGSGGPRVRNVLHVRQLPAGQIFVAAGLEIWSPASFQPAELRVVSCDGPVIVEDLIFDRLDVRSSADVRLQRIEARHATVSAPSRIIASRVELVDSIVRGAAGDELSCATETGGRGLDIESSFVHVASSSVSGGEGGWCREDVWGCCSGGGGTGGTGLLATDSQIVLTGAPGHGMVAGGHGGGTWEINGTGSPHTGDDGAGVDVAGAAASMPSMRVSDLAITGDPARLVGPNVAVTNTTGDPLLRLGSAAQAGAPLLVEVFGAPGDAAQLDFGRSPQLASLSGSAIEVLTSAQRQAAIGTIPPSGRLTISLNLPPNWPSGTLFFLQARASDPSTGAVRMSNSAPLIVR